MNPTLITVILPSYLGTYAGCAMNREAKFRRAVKSFIGQDYINKHLIIISDGCSITSEIVRKEFKIPEISLIEIEKQELFSGTVRQAGLEKCLHGIVAYLDSDDLFTSANHLSVIVSSMEKTEVDWVYYDGIFSNGKMVYGKRETCLVYCGIGTSSIAHRVLPGLSWEGCDGYGHDWQFIEKMMKLYPNYKKIFGTGYGICHVYNQLEC